MRTEDKSKSVNWLIKKVCQLFQLRSSCQTSFTRWHCPFKVAAIVTQVLYLYLPHRRQHGQNSSKLADGKAYTNAYELLRSATKPVVSYSTWTTICMHMRCIIPPTLSYCRGIPILVHSARPPVLLILCAKPSLGSYLNIFPLLASPNNAWLEWIKSGEK